MGAVFWAVEEDNHLFGNYATEIVSLVGGDNEDTWLGDLQRSLIFAQGDTTRVEAGFFNRTMGVIYCGEEVDELRRGDSLRI